MLPGVAAHTVHIVGRYNYFGGMPTLGLRSLFIYEPDLDVLRKRLDDRPDTWWSGVPEQEKSAMVAMFHARGLRDTRVAETLRLPVVAYVPSDTHLERAVAALGLTARDSRHV